MSFSRLLLWPCLALLSLSLLALSAPGPASAQARVLRVAIKPVAPFVMVEGDPAKGQDRTYRGFSIDLWREIARRQDWQFEWLMFDTVGEVLEAVEQGRADLGIAAISITSEREKKLDFTQPMFDAGLQVMTPAQQSTSFLDGLRAVINSNLGAILGIVAIAIFIAANLIWLIERGKNPKIPHGYLGGLRASLWWALITFLTLGFDEDKVHSRLGKVFALFWMFVGIILIANFTAVITSNFTLQELRGSVNGLDDLYGKRVVTVEGTTAEQFLKTINVQVITAPTAEEAYELLRQGSAEAMVYDAPVLLNYTATAGRGTFRTVGQVFNREYYGIALPHGSDLREPLNVALLEMRQDGEFERISDRWFKAD